MKEFKELILTLFKGSEERFKNPFFRAFFTSWVIFNWKAIAFFIFSKLPISNKIELIDSKYSPWYLLWLFPLLSALFYYLFFPTITVWFDKLRVKAIKEKKEIITERKKDDIDNQITISIKEISLEQEKTKFREQHTHNIIVEDLQNKIRSYEEQIDAITQRNENQTQRLENEILEAEKINKKMNEEFINLKNKLKLKESETLLLEKEVNDLKYDLQESVKTENEKIQRNKTMQNLTGREIEILRLINNYSAIEITKKLNIDISRYKEHLTRIKDKFNLQTDDDIKVLALNSNF
jgi:DNA-binding CsgD family transcriptional regulator